MIHKLRNAFIALILAALPVTLAAQESTLNAEVAVDGTGKDGSEAKANALAKGEQEAFKKVAKEFLQTEEVPAFDASKVPLLVDSFEVKEEKIAANRYRAKVTYLFNLERVTAFLASAAIEDPNQSAAPKGPTNKILILAPITSLADWQDIKGRLEKGGAMTVKVLAFSLNQVDAELGLAGDPNRLAQTLKPQGLGLTREGEYWIVRKQ